MPFQLFSRRFSRSLAFRFIAISTLAVVALVPLRIMEVRSVRQQADEAGFVRVSRIATNGIERLKDILDESKTILTLTASLPTFAAPGTPDCHPILTGIVAETAWMNSLSAVAADGTVICSSTSTGENINIQDRAYFRGAISERRYSLSGVVLSRRTNAPTLFAAVPVSAPGSATAALVMGMNASWFSDVARDVAHSAFDGIAIVIDGEGNVLGAPQGAQGAAAVLEAILPEVKRIEHEDARPVKLADGSTLVIAVREIPYSNSLLIVGVPQAALSSQALAIEANLMEDFAVAIGIIILVFWLGHESFVRPVTTLAAAAHRLGRGRFDIAIDSRRWAREFQTLAAAIEAASESLADRAKAEAELKANLRAQSLEDPLTGLKNRRGLDQYVDLEWRICRRKTTWFTVIAFDIDFFKAYNDRYGHDAGDQALTTVARVMHDQAIQAGGMAARTGGEEFTLVIPDRTAVEARAVADAISLRITALRIPHAGSPLGTLTISAGIASALPTDALTFADVFRAGDQALYGSKEAGRNTITIGDVAIAPALAPAIADAAG